MSVIQICMDRRNTEAIRLSADLHVHVADKLVSGVRLLKLALHSMQHVTCAVFARTCSRRHYYTYENVAIS